MSMHLRRAVFVIALTGLFTLLSAWAQQRPSPAGATPQGGSTGAKGPASQKYEPCWEQAGISKSVIEQRKSIHESTRSEIQAVCSEPNLSEEQKREKIHQIRQAAQEKVNAMISPGERQQVEACQHAHHASGPKTGGHAAPSDPCAGVGR
jgi:hypothetical protein